MYNFIDQYMTLSIEGKYPTQAQSLFHKINTASDQITSLLRTSWEDWLLQFDKVEVSQPQVSKPSSKMSKEKQKGLLKIKINASALKQQPNQQQKKPSKQASFKKRIHSNITQLKSIQKKNEGQVKEDEEKRLQRLKQVMKRKFELMEKLKKMDSELIELRKDGSPSPERKDERTFLYQSNLNRSFLNNSRINKQHSQNVIQQHSKAMQMLTKINNEKIRRQQKIAQDIKKKQQTQLLKLQQIEKKKSVQLESKVKRNEGYLLMGKKDINNVKFNSIGLEENNENLVLPMTLIQSENKKASIDGSQFFERLEKRSSKLLTERDIQNQGEGGQRSKQLAVENQISIEHQ